MSAEQELWDRARAALRPADGTRDERVGYLLSTLAENAPAALAAALDQLERYYVRPAAVADVDEAVGAAVHADGPRQRGVQGPD